MSDSWIGTDEAAEYLGIGKTKLYQLTREKRISATRIGKKWTYDREELADWVRSNKNLNQHPVETKGDLSRPHRSIVRRARIGRSPQPMASSATTDEEVRCGCPGSKK